MRDAVMAVGVICVLSGLVLRPRRGDTKGLSFALIVVGALMLVAGPAGRLAKVW